jgi:DNA topoisomerase 2-associated protein PAT1
MLLSRAEILVQNLITSGYAMSEEVINWKNSYTHLFNTLQGHFASFFPVAGIDDSYVWQFLAAIAAGANIEQQHILVTETR